MFYSLDNLKNVERDVNQLKDIYIDVGAAQGMTHGASWLLCDDEAFVIGIEPNIEALAILEKGRPPISNPYLKLENCSVWKEGKEIKRCNPRQVCVIQCAVDAVPERTRSIFFHTDQRNIGCSSLLKPTSNLEVDVTHTSEVDVCSLENILDDLNMESIEEIAFVKTDTQGKDCDVVKSLGKYLPRVLALKCEYTADNIYENSNSKEDLIKFMLHNGFGPIYDTCDDLIFINGRIYSYSGYEEIEEGQSLQLGAVSQYYLDKLFSILENMHL